MFYDSQFDVAFYFLAKNANTAAKIMLLEARSGTEIKDKIHQRIPTSFPKAIFIPQDQAKYRITIVRDPVERFVSAYQDKIMRREWLDPKLPVDEFIDNIDGFLKENRRLEQHFEPQWMYLGENINYFTHVYRPREMRKLASLFGSIYPHRPQFRKENVAKFALKLDNHQEDWIREVWARKDYELGYC